MTGFSFIGTGLPASAQSTQSAPDEAPSVARLSVADGNVSIKQDDSGETVAGSINAPLEPGDYLTTGDGARAEVQLDGGNALRAGEDTQLRLTQIGPGVAQVAQGTVELRTFDTQYGADEIDTPNASVRPDTNGAYRVSVDDQGNSYITVRSGHATVALGSSTEDLMPGSTMRVVGAANNPQYSYVGEVASDGFDAWNQDRDQIVASASDQYVNGNVIGSQDLNDYGQWENNPQYGQVWVPYEGPGWAPYQDGQWVWTGYYGWTWVGSEPWGWAPYHYGRWFYAANVGWAWYPGGPAYVRPVWQPGLVAFFGFGSGVSVGLGVGFGNIGWVPLAPGEAYHPWWGGYGSGNVSIINNTTIVNGIGGYRNIHAPGGLAAVPYTGWQHGDFAHRVAVPTNFDRVSAVHGVVPVVPTRDNLRFNSHAVASADLPRTNPRFASFTRGAVNTPRVSFAQQQHAVETVTRDRFATTDHRQSAPSFNAGTHFGTTSARTNVNLGSRGSASFDRAPQQTQMRAANATRPAVNDVWGRFNTARFGSANVRANEGLSRAQTYGSRGTASGLGSRPATSTQAHAFNDVQRPANESRGITPSTRPATNDAWGRFNQARPGYAQTPRYSGSAYARPSSSYSSPGAQRYSAPQYARPSYSQQRYSAPQYARPSYSQQRYSAPQYARPSYSQQRYSAPHYSSSRPSYSAPRSSGSGSGGHGPGRPQ